MEHIDSRIQLNPKRLKALQLIKQKYQWNGALNGAFVSVLILFGIIGVLTVLYLQASHAAHQSAKKVSLTANQQVNNPKVQPAALINAEEHPSKFVTISGELKPKSEISLMIDSYDPKAGYLLDLGNGEKIKVDKKVVKLSYPGPGIYYPVLKISFRDETEEVALEKIWIR